MPLKKIGDGDRVRRPANYRNVGGEARRSALSGKVSLPTKKKFKPVPISRPPPADDMPDPGGHPAKLLEKARAHGYKPTMSPLEALKKQAASLAQQAGYDPTTSAPPDLDELFQKKVAQDRPNRSEKEEREKLEKLRKKLPILRMQRRIEYEPEQRQEGSDDNEVERQYDATIDSGDDGTGRASESRGGSEQSNIQTREGRTGSWLQRHLSARQPELPAKQAVADWPQPVPFVSVKLSGKTISFNHRSWIPSFRELHPSRSEQYFGKGHKQAN